MTERLLRVRFGQRLRHIPVGSIPENWARRSIRKRPSGARTRCRLASARAEAHAQRHHTYRAAKAALDYYSRTLAVELGPSGIRVNVVSPGPISTANANEVRKQFPISGDEWFKFVPLGWVGTTEDIAEVVALLASDRGQFPTGVNYRIDGGMTAL